MGEHISQQQREEHANISDVHGKKVFVFDGAGNQVTTFSTATVNVENASSIGLATVTIDGGEVAIAAGESYIGLVTVDMGDMVIDAGENYIGLATVDVGNAVTLGAGVAGIGFATVAQGSTPWNSLGTTTVGAALPAGANYVGLATVDVGAPVGMSYKYTSGPTTNWIVKGSAGHLHSITFGAPVASSVVEISDHATDGDGNVQFYFADDTLGPATYPLGATMGTGITLDVTNQTHVTVIYR